MSGERFVVEADRKVVGIAVKDRGGFRFFASDKDYQDLGVVPSGEDAREQGHAAVAQARPGGPAVFPARAVDGPVNAPVNAPMNAGVQDRRERPRLRIATSPDRRIADLIRRYPDVSSGEKEELRRFIDAACPIEVQRLRSDARLRPLFDRAARDIRGPLYGRGEIISAICLALLFLASCWLLWSTSQF